MPQEMLVVVLIVLFIIFLICRELFCWYYKINKAVALLTDINENLKELLAESRSAPHNTAVMPPVTKEERSLA